MDCSPHFCHALPQFPLLPLRLLTEISVPHDCLTHCHDNSFVCGREVPRPENQRRKTQRGHTHTHTGGEATRGSSPVFASQPRISPPDCSRVSSLVRSDPSAFSLHLNAKSLFLLTPPEIEKNCECSWQHDLIYTWHWDPYLWSDHKLMTLKCRWPQYICRVNANLSRFVT